MEPHERSSQPEIWPPSPLPPCTVRARPRANVRDDGWIKTPLVEVVADEFGDLVLNEPSEWREAPPELHLREFRNVDTSDADSLLELVQLVGFPLNPQAPERGVIDPGNTDGRDLYEFQLSWMADRLPFDQPDLDTRPGIESVHLVEVALRVEYVRRMVDHVDADLHDEPVEAVWQLDGLIDFANTMYGYAEDPKHDSLSAEEAARREFQQRLNEGLSSGGGLSPRLVYSGDDPVIVDAYTAACACIANDYNNRMPYRRCEYEKCGRLFLKQLGRRTTDAATRSDATFCTHQHAKNQYQLKTRRARRAANQRKG